VRCSYSSCFNGTFKNTSFVSARQTSLHLKTSFVFSLQNEYFHPEASTLFSLELYISKATFLCNCLCVILLKWNVGTLKSAAVLRRSSVLSAFAAGHRFSEASPLPFVAEPATTKGSFTAVSAQTICPVICVLTEVTMGGLTPMRRSIQATTMKASAVRFRQNRRRESYKTSLCAFFRIVLGRSVFWGIIIRMESSVSITQHVWAMGNPPLAVGFIPLMITSLVQNLVHWSYRIVLFWMTF